MRHLPHRLPELTPFGRRFKIGGYTMQGGDWQGPPLAAMYMPSFTHTNSPQDSPPAPGLHTNDNLVSQQVSGFVAGRLYGNLGSFIQVTGNPIAGTAALDASDVRYADTLKLFGQDTIWGIDANNTPTVEDPWNTTPAFGWPQNLVDYRARLRPAVDAYRERTGPDRRRRRRLSVLERHTLRRLHGLQGPASRGSRRRSATATRRRTPSPTSRRIRRLAAEPHWGPHYLEVGTFGMYSQIAPGRMYGFGTDNYLDVGFDSQYQYDGDLYSVTVKLTDIMEWQKLNASTALGAASNLSNTLNSFKANASFVWDHTYSLGFGYFNIAGSHDCNMYGSGFNPLCTPANGGEAGGSPGPFNFSFNNSPYGNGLILDLAYIPFSHGSPFPYNTWNARIGIQFTQYLHLYGGTNNFDGSYLGGTHNASGNNSVFAYAWLAF